MNSNIDTHWDLGFSRIIAPYHLKLLLDLSNGDNVVSNLTVIKSSQFKWRPFLLVVVNGC